MQYLGEIAGLSAAFCWGATALLFQQASIRIGSLVVNLLRLILAAILYMAYTKVVHGIWLPQVSLHAWTFLGISSLFGFILGDFFLFKSYEYINSRTSMLLMSLAPLFAAFTAWLVLGESLTRVNYLGMLLVLLGVSIVILFRPTKGKDRETFSTRGIIYALLGAVGQGVGAVFSKIGMLDCDAFVASQVRVLVGVVGFLVVITAMRRWPKVRASFSNKQGLKFTALGSFTGPFLGVGLAMVAFKYIPVGVASTLTATVPIFILAPAALFLKEKITFREVIGAVVAVLGILVFFIE